MLLLLVVCCLLQPIDSDAFVAANVKEMLAVAVAAHVPHHLQLNHELGDEKLWDDVEHEMLDDVLQYVMYS